MLIYELKVVPCGFQYLFCNIFHHLLTRIIQIWHVPWQITFKIVQFQTKCILSTIISLDRKGLQLWFTCQFMQNLISFKLIPNLVYFNKRIIQKIQKCFPYPLIFQLSEKNTVNQSNWQYRKTIRATCLKIWSIMPRTSFHIVMLLIFLHPV